MVITKDLVCLNRPERTKEAILDALCAKAVEAGRIADVQGYREAVAKREEEFSTALGYLIALPHGQSDAVTTPFVAVATTSEAFRWDDRSENLVRLVFMIGVPLKNRENTHLRILANISRKLMEDEFREKLLSLNDTEEAFALLSSIEA